ncbi:MAG: hypothetical protein EP343_18650 [Deltaproteobacteria bacterium]|nr:MAG: hypothetical protein EP343_18650 [Deltaproteobacteria bacterium]
MTSRASLFSHRGLSPRRCRSPLSTLLWMVLCMGWLWGMGTWTGCAECQFDLDCPGAGSQCRQGQCIEREPVSNRNTPPPVCATGQREPCYTGPKETIDEGPCRQGERVCSGEGQWGPCLNEITPITDVCNGKDDDCDGTIDEGCKCQDGDTRKCYTGQPETQGVGVCKGGTQTCVNQEWGACEGEQAPSKEVCNGQDDDCDGQTDEDIPNGQDCQVPGAKGPCAKGSSLCQNGQASCQPTVQPQAEKCANGIDEDCDGEIDEPPCACKPGETQSCYSGPSGTAGKADCKAGTQTCSNTGGWGPCVGEILPQQETCNGKDDDCDGQIDGMTRPCTQGCNKGQERCQLSQWLSCDAQPAEGEVCDGKDNDCNGLIDDVAGSPCQCNTGAKRPCGSSVGVCQQGQQECINGQWSLFCQGEVKGSTESCDGKDNDCNGTVDDNLTCSFSRVYWSGPGTQSYFCFGSQMFVLASEMARLCRFGSSTPVTWKKTCLDAFSKSFIPMDHSTCRQRVYRYDFTKNGNTHHYYIADDAWTGYKNDKYTKVGEVFRALTKKVAGTVECKTYTNWTLRDTVVICGTSSETTTLLNQGYTEVESLGWMSKDTSTSGIKLHGLTLKPVWRSYNKTLKAHLFTTSKSDHDKSVNQQGYVKEPNIGQGIP